jgi:hypothetical protein
MGKCSNVTSSVGFAIKGCSNDPTASPVTIGEGLGRLQIRVG